jgi:multiple sugar transport system substrate-binding protein
MPDASPLWPAIHGVELLGEDGLSAKLDDPATIDVYTNYKKLVDAQGGWTKVKSFKDSWDFFGAKNPFVTDQVGAMVVEQWYLTVLAETAPTKIDFTVVPIKGKDGNPVTIQVGGSWVIPNKSKNPQAACQFAKLMTSLDAWLAAANAKTAVFGKEGKYYAGTYTGNKSADEQIFGADNSGGIWKPGTQGDQFAQFDDAVSSALELQPNAIEEPASPIGNQFNTSLQNALNRILQGEQDVPAALKRAQGEVDDAAEKAR